MSTLSVRLPNSLHEQIRELAKKEGISINQFIATAAAEKLAALMTEEYLDKRAARASREKFDAALAQLPDITPDKHDRMPLIPGESRVERQNEPSSRITRKGRTMASYYRRRKGSDTWHFCSNCSNWPTGNYDRRESKPTAGELCNECQSKRRNKDCD